MVKVISVQATDNFKLLVHLSDNRNGIFDVSPYLERGVFKELKDAEYFSRVRVSYGGVSWPHEQDFSAETIEYELQPTPAESEEGAEDIAAFESRVREPLISYDEMVKKLKKKDKK